MPTLTSSPAFNPFYNDLHERPDPVPMILEQTPGMTTDPILQSSTPVSDLAARRGHVMDRVRAQYHPHQKTLLPEPGITHIAILVILLLVITYIKSSR